MALTLQNSIIGQADINRLLRELNTLDDFFVGAAVRKSGDSITPPKTTQVLEDLAKLNKLKLLETADRAKLTKQLDELLVKAPKLQISFAVDPPPKVLYAILDWLRKNLDPGILLQVGLQPNIGAGCVLRTPNREFDMSMRQHLADSKPYLVQLINMAAKTAAFAPQAPQPVVAAPPPVHQSTITTPLPVRQQQPAPAPQKQGGHGE